MISLKRYLDQSYDPSSDAAIEGYLATLEAIGTGALRCCHATGETLKRELAGASETLKQDRSPRVFRVALDHALKSLKSWGEETEAYFARKTTEVKEIIGELAGTAETLGKHDQRYVQQFSEITANLQQIAGLDDLARMKSSMLRNASELKGCVDRMTREMRASIAQLEASVASHRVQLEQAQELAALDPLTGLYNSREVEGRLAEKRTEQTPFCIVLVELSEFKQINIRHGHAAGDELLRQISKELRMASRAQDVLGRWGGDQFIMLVEGNLINTRVKVERMRPWVFGNYDLLIAGKALSIVVNAFIGMSEWSPGETVHQVLSRVDADMNRDRLARV